MAELAVRVVAVAVGAAIVMATFGSAVRTVVLPRAVQARLTVTVFQVVRTAFRLPLGRGPSYERRDRVLAPFAPVALLCLLASWMALTWMGFAAVHWGLGERPFLRAVELSGSSLTTLGFVAPSAASLLVAAVVEAVIGLVLLALLITYLPSLYSSFSRRESLVTKLEVRAGSPPSGTELLWRAWVVGRFDTLDGVWTDWESWFVDIEETHTSFGALGLFRSPQPEHSWVTAAGAVLDGAALRVSSMDYDRDWQAQMTIRAGFLALRRIAASYGIRYPTDPHWPQDPVSVTREEWERELDRLAESGLPVRADRDAAWADFAGWRVNYDRVLIGLATMTAAPYAPWSSDRSLAVDAQPRVWRLTGVGR
jgi:hypothetical protein